jgi:transcriptional regulator with XRE-family HTH domain
MNMQIGERIKQLRREKCLTQQQIANTLKIDRSNYSKYELGKLEVNNEMLIKLATLFDVSTDYILGLED